MTQPDRTRVLTNITNCQDPARLRVYMKNAQARGADEIYDAAFHQLIQVQPTAQVGTVARDARRTIHAFEELLRFERGKTVRLSRTRQAIKNKGEVRTVTDLVLGKNASGGFAMLQERNLLKMSFEAIVIARSDHFAVDVVERARTRLVYANVDLDEVISYWREF